MAEHFAVASRNTITDAPASAVAPASARAKVDRPGSGALLDGGAWTVALLVVAAVGRTDLVAALALAPLVLVVHAAVRGLTGIGVAERQHHDVAASDLLFTALVTATCVIAVDLAWAVTDVGSSSLLTSAVVATAGTAGGRLWRRYDEAIDALGRRDIIDLTQLEEALAPRPATHRSQVLGLLECAAKRAIDIAVAFVALVAAALPLLILAAAVRLASPGSALFRQTRIGLGGKAFTIYKLRSMSSAHVEAFLADDDIRSLYEANDFKLPDDLASATVTPLGRLLRKTSLDELPQLWNVLKGDMSIVGPRPVVVDELANYGDDRVHYLATKPGLTGCWQVSGRSSIGYPERVDFDVFYASHQSVALDLYLTLRTVPAVLLQRGAR